MVKYGYGIDLAQTLNYCGIVIIRIDKNIQIQTLRKFNKVLYPNIKKLLIHELFPRFPPTYVATDYSNEKAFSEELEAMINPTFTLEGHREYKKWNTVLPIRFTMESKLAMKQNSRYILENKLFTPPSKVGSPPEIWALWEELQQQLLRENADPNPQGQLRFPKPDGYDNDLAMAFELALFGAKNYIGEMSGDIERQSIVMTINSDTYKAKKTGILNNPRIKNRIKSISDLTGVEINGIKIEKKDISWLN